VAGVAAGIGRYFDLDPVIVRIAFVVLAVLGGSGVLLYLVAWLVIAKEGKDESMVSQALQGGDAPRGRGVVAALLLLAAVFIVTGPTLWLADIGFGADGLFFPLMLVAAGVALLLWPDDTDWSSVRKRVGYPDAGGSGPEAPTASPTPSTDGVEELFEGVEERSEDPDELRRRSFPITSLTLAALLVLTGVAVLLDRVDAIELRPVTYLAAVLVVVGIGLVGSAFVGRARGLIALGLLILPFLWFATVVDIEWWSGVGDETVVVDNIDDLERSYHHGIGELVIDLHDLDLDGETVELEVGLTIGKVEVIVPADTEVDVDLDGRIGQLTVVGPGRDLIDDGMDNSIATTLPGSNGRLVLDLDIGIGQARVQVTT
jgi:phage shock protein PspC (stress-responsive transcriptional regulator)